CPWLLSNSPQLFDGQADAPEFHGRPLCSRDRRVGRGRRPPTGSRIPCVATEPGFCGHLVVGATPARGLHSSASESGTSAHPATPGPATPERFCCSGSGRLPLGETNAAC